MSCAQPLDTKQHRKKALLSTGRQPGCAPCSSGARGALNRLQNSPALVARALVAPHGRVVRCTAPATMDADVQALSAALLVAVQEQQGRAAAALRADGVAAAADTAAPPTAVDGDPLCAALAALLEGHRRQCRAAGVSAVPRGAGAGGAVPAESEDVGPVAAACGRRGAILQARTIRRRCRSRSFLICLHDEPPFRRALAAPASSSAVQIAF